MQLEKEITKAINHISAKNTQKCLTQKEQDNLVNKVLQDVRNNNWNFDNLDILILQQSSKKRLVKQYKDRYSTENILCQCIKQVLDKEFKVKYPNRNKISRELFGILSAVAQMVDYTIVKFDFKDYFNSLSAEYIYYKHIENKIPDRLIKRIIYDYCIKTEYTFAGLPTSNAMAEIVASEFDKVLQQTFGSLGIVFYSRYIDDSVLILNRQVNEDIVKKMLSDILLKVFRDKTIDVKKYCTTNYNPKKYSYISKRALSGTPISFDFLGYEFWLNISQKNLTDIKYGITEEKRIKYCKRLDKIIKLYTNNDSADYYNIKLLRHRVLAFSSRQVYLSTKYKSNIWKAKGFISNYAELRFLPEKLLHDDTKKYLKEMIVDSFSKAHVNLYFSDALKQENSGYNLYHNLKVNKTLLLVDGIGYDYKSLSRLCEQIGISSIDANGKKRPYRSLVRDYLIKVKVGY